MTFWRKRQGRGGLIQKNIELHNGKFNYHLESLL